MTANGRAFTKSIIGNFWYKFVAQTTIVAGHFIPTPYVKELGQTSNMTTTMMMEASSPLAAMQQPSFLNRCGFGQDALSYAAFARSNFNTDAFNFKDLSMMGRPQMDYFSMPPPVRGSSPTASLAADLSQNMNIDRRYVKVLTVWK